MGFLEFLLTFFLSDYLASKDEEEERQSYLESELDDLRSEVDDLKALGQLMVASHASLRDDFEVSCPEVNLLVEIALGVKGVYGARLTGAGFGGSMVALVQPEAAAELTDAISKRYGPVSGRQATVYVCKASEGVSEITN